jgi:hypothetical protein
MTLQPSKWCSYNAVTFQISKIFFHIFLGRVLITAKTPIAFVMSVRLSSRISADPTGRISVKLYIGGVYIDLSGELKFG